MSTLNIRVEGADEETKRRAVEALSADGISVDRAWLDEGATDAVPPGAAVGRADEAPSPHGWAKWVSIALFSGFIALLIAWIWAGDGRLGGTAAVVFLVAGVFFLGSF